MASVDFACGHSLLLSPLIGMSQVVGPRNCGKTALINAFLEDKRDKGTLVAHINGRSQNIADPSVLIGMLEEEVAFNMRAWTNLGYMNLMETSVSVQGVQISGARLARWLLSEPSKDVNGLIKKYQVLISQYNKQVLRVQ